MASQASPLVSIGIPTYNRADSYLGETLRSALAQTYPNLEIIVGDNGSTDQTEELMAGFSDPRLHYFRHSKTVTANENYNSCLERAKGSYFLLLHDDDIVDADFIQVSMDATEGSESLGIIRTGTRIIDGDGRVRREVPNEAMGLDTTGFFLSWFSGKTALYLCSTLYNTHQLKAVGGFRSKRNLFDDVVPLLQLAAKDGRVDVRDVKASFRRHDDNRGSSQDVANWSDDSLHVLDLMCDLVPEDSAIIRREGLRFFSRKSYRGARRIESRYQRARAYLRIYREFGYTYSPLRFLFPRYVGRLRRVISSRLGLL